MPLLLTICEGLFVTLVPRCSVAELGRVIKFSSLSRDFDLQKLKSEL